MASKQRVLLLGCFVALAACSGNRDVLPVAAGLSLATTCEDVRAAYEADAIAKIDRQVEEALTNRYGTRGGIEFDAARSGVPGAPSSTTGGAMPAPMAHSETNTQVEGVDEADIVKTDGTRIFTLVDGRLRLLRSWPADQTREVASLAIEGSGIDLFLDGDRLVVFSSTQDPRATPTDCSRGGPAIGGRGGFAPYCYGRQYTKLTVVSAAGDALRSERELYFEGGYQTSRRYQDVVRMVLQQWNWYWDWSLPGIWEYLSREGAPSEYESVTEYGYTYTRLTAAAQRARLELWRRDATAAVRARTVADWLPARLERVDGALVEAAPDCGRAYFPRPGVVDYGVTQLIGLDLSREGSAISTATISGYTSTVYSSAGTLVLAQPDWSASARAYDSGAERYSDSTLIHRFSLGADGGADYVASAYVAGSINNQFSIDEHNGVIRVASTESSWPVWRPGFTGPWTTTTRNFVSTYANERVSVCSRGECSATTTVLAPIGRVELFTDNERVQSARFMGNIGYVVTFRQTDPLFAVDLTDARNPRVLGELHIDGFSTYIHPLDTTHLLTIGFDATPEGRRTGLALQIFDVSNPVSPRLAHRHVFRDDNWGYSEANWDHKAFTFFAERGLLAFPYAGWGNRSDGSYSYHSSLEVFHVGAASGFRPVASLNHTGLIGPRCYTSESWSCSYYDASVRRGVFADDFVYSISAGGVLVHDTRDVSEVARVPFLPVIAE